MRRGMEGTAVQARLQVTTASHAQLNSMAVTEIIDE